MGLKFFRKVIELQKRYRRDVSIVSNGLQTNGTLINENLARYLNKYKFLVGVSLDGPQYIHDYYRKTARGNATFNRVMNGIEILKRNEAGFNILVLVNDFNVEKAKEVYDFLIENGLHYQQYIPYVEFDSNGDLKSYSIDGWQWGRFLIELFNQRYPKDIYRVSIRIFDSTINHLAGRKVTICHMSRNCNTYLVVEYNGDIYPCDFYVRESLKLGNINESSLDDLIRSPVYADFDLLNLLNLLDILDLLPRP